VFRLQLRSKHLLTRQTRSPSRGNPFRKLVRRVSTVSATIWSDANSWKWTPRWDKVWLHTLPGDSHSFGQSPWTSTKTV